MTEKLAARKRPHPCRRTSYDHDEHNQLIDARIGGHQNDVNGLSQRVTESLDKVSAYLHSMAELEGDIRKRQIIALEKEIRDVRSKSLTFDE